MAVKSDLPIVFIVGATGQTGRLLIKEFDRHPGEVQLRLSEARLA